MNGQRCITLDILENIALGCCERNTTYEFELVASLP